MDDGQGSTRGTGGGRISSDQLKYLPAVVVVVVATVVILSTENEIKYINSKLFCLIKQTIHLESGQSCDEFNKEQETYDIKKDDKLAQSKTQQPKYHTTLSNNYSFKKWEILDLIRPMSCDVMCFYLLTLRGSPHHFQPHFHRRRPGALRTLWRGWALLSGRC